MQYILLFIFSSGGDLFNCIGSATDPLCILHSVHCICTDMKFSMANKLIRKGDKNQWHQRHYHVFISKAQCSPSVAGTHKSRPKLAATSMILPHRALSSQWSTPWILQSKGIAISKSKWRQRLWQMSRLRGGGWGTCEFLPTGSLGYTWTWSMLQQLLKSASLSPDWSLPLPMFDFLGLLVIFFLTFTILLS